MSGHTPGPWVFEEHPHFESGYSVMTNEHEPWAIAAVWGFCGEDGSDSLSNARLIAAAPDLLDALRDYACPADCESQLKDGTCVRSTFHHCGAGARAAIARATNGTGAEKNPTQEDLLRSIKWGEK